MTDVLAQALGINPNDYSVMLAVRQTREDRSWLGELIRLRHRGHPDDVKFASALGVEVEELLDFEADPLSFDLPFIRVYANAVGAFVMHAVLPRPDVSRWVFLSDYEEPPGPAEGTWTVDPNVLLHKSGELVSR